MAFLPKLFRHDHSQEEKASKVKVVAETNKKLSIKNDFTPNNFDIIVNSGFIIQVIEENILNIISLSDNHGFIHKFDEKILKVAPNRERENFFLILCSSDTIHLVKINDLSVKNSNAGLVQVISSFKIPNVISVEWHPTLPQKFFTAGPCEICIWNLLQLNSLTLKSSPGATEITLELASQCAKVLPIAPFYEFLRLKSSQLKLLHGNFKSESNDGIKSTTCVILDDEYAAFIEEMNESGENLPTLNLRQCVQLSVASTDGGSSGYENRWVSKVHFTYGQNLAAIIGDDLIIYRFDELSCAFSNSCAIEIANQMVSSDDELVSKSEGEDPQIAVAKVFPSHVVKLPFKPAFHAVTSNSLFIYSGNSPKGSNSVSVCLVELEGFTSKLINLNLPGEGISFPFNLNGMAIFSHLTISFLYLIAINGDRAVNEFACTECEGESTSGGNRGLESELLKINYSDGFPEGYKMKVIRTNINHLDRMEMKLLASHQSGKKSEKAPGTRARDVGKANRVMEGEKTASGHDDRNLSEKSSKSKKQSEKSSDKSSQGQTDKSHKKEPAVVALKSHKNEFPALTPEGLSHPEIETMIKELVRNVLVPGIHDALKVSLESMGLQIISHLSSKNGMYSSLIKRLDKIAEGIGELGDKIGEVSSKIDEINKSVSVRIDSLEENIESNNYELSAKYQSFDDKLLDLIGHQEYDRAFALASQMDLDTDSDFTIALCEHFDISTFLESDPPPLTQLTLLKTCAALARSTDHLDLRISWILECISLLDSSFKDYPTKKIPVMIPKIMYYLDGARSYCHLRDKRFPAVGGEKVEKVEFDFLDYEFNF